jgi:hypothetical protein
MTTRGHFKRILDDPERSEVLMDWEVARVCRRARGQVEQMGAVAFRVDGQALFLLDLRSNQHATRVPQPRTLGSP